MLWRKRKAGSAEMGVVILTKVDRVSLSNNVVKYKYRTYT